MRRKFVYAAGMLLCVGLFAACAPAADGAPPALTTSAAPASTQPSARPTQDNTGLVARVNGVGISEAEFAQTLARRQIGLEVANPDVLAAQVLEGLIEQELVRQYAAKNGITVSESDLDAEIAVLKQAVAGQMTWEAFLQMNGYSDDEMREAQRDSLLNQRVRDSLFAGLNGNVRQAHARHIVVSSPQQASDLLAQLQAGADFAALVAQYSIDQSNNQNGGDLGWFTAEELVDMRLGEVIFALQTGAIAGPVPSRIGYHIVQLLAMEDRPLEPERMAVLMENRYLRWLNEQMTLADIERYR